MRGKPEKFAEHFHQATLFYNSQTLVEQAHIRRGFRFELTKVRVTAIRARVVSMLANVDAALAATLASELGLDMPAAMPRALAAPPAPEVVISPALSLRHLPGEGSIRTRRVAILVAHGVAGAVAEATHAHLSELGAVPRYVGDRLGGVETEDGREIEVEVTFETMPSVLFDAAVVPGGRAAVETLAHIGPAVDFLRDQYRHAKPILLMGDVAELADAAGIETHLSSGEPDPGVIVGGEDASEVLPAFVTAIARHRHHEREMDPPEA